MDQLSTACTECRQYPWNLPDREHLDYVLSSYFQKLNEHQPRLFTDEKDAELTFRDFDNGGKSSCQ